MALLNGLKVPHALRRYPAHLLKQPRYWSRDESRDCPKAVIFDIGGVVVPSPFPLIGRFEERHLLPKGSINETIRNYGQDGTFAKLEKGEVTLEQFCEPFAKEFTEFHGISLSQEQAWELARGLGGLDVSLIPYKEVVDLMRKLKEAGLKVAVVTNNFKFDSGETVLPKEELKHVDVFIQSCVVGIKKPDQAIYIKALQELGVEGRETVFLDDIGGNLKSAAQLGITTIKVDDISSAIQQVENLVFQNKEKSSFPEGTSIVSDKLQLPLESLTVYLQETLGLREESGPLLIRMFQHGQSNPTYYLEYGGERMVLRKKPPGKLLPSAHAVEREYRVMSAVGQYGVPCPPLLSLCEDESVIGTPFYVMKYVPGRVFKDPSLPHLKPSDRKEIYSQMCHTLATIHNVNIDKAKLGDYGKQGNYVKRQIDRWTKQYRASMTHDITDMELLIQWLNSNTPDSDTTTVVHGDYRIDNLIYAPEDNTVLAVLDWELSTLGDPYSDLAYCCMPYYRPPTNPILVGLQGLDYSTLGIPTEEQFLSQYCQLRGLSHIPHWSFYLSFSFFRVAAILQGVYKRALQNQASSDNAKTLGAMAESYAQQGLKLTTSRPFPHTGGGKPLHSRSYSTSSTDVTGLLINDVTRFPPYVREIREKLVTFMNQYVFPNEQIIRLHQSSADGWKSHPLIEELKLKAKSVGLWNLFLPIENDPTGEYGAGLSNLEYAPLAEIMGQCVYASEIFNCSPPDTGNMEVLVRYGTGEQKNQWLHPLLDGEIRSCFAMTEPAVASSDATNIQSSIVADGNHYVLNGRKWWASGGTDPRCKVCIFMGKTDPNAEKHKQQSMILVAMDTPGIHVVRPLTVFGYDDAPSGHAEIIFDNVQVPKENLLLGEGRGFEIAQGRLGPGRIHHCMRLIGMCERAIDLMNNRVQNRVAFGKKLSQFDTIISDIAQSRIDTDQARLLTLKAAHMMDTVGNKVARNDIAMIKVVAPHVAQQVIDRAIQAHGAMGLSEDTPLAQLFAWSRILRLADGPDEVHIRSIGQSELRKTSPKN